LDLLFFVSSLGSGRGWVFSSSRVFKTDANWSGALGLRGGMGVGARFLLATFFGSSFGSGLGLASFFGLGSGFTITATFSSTGSGSGSGAGGSWTEPCGAGGGAGGAGGGLGSALAISFFGSGCFALVGKLVTSVTVIISTEMGMS